MNEPTTTPEWAVALDRFRGGYGGEPDLDDYTDRFLFLELLTYEIRAQMERDMAAFFWAEVKKLEPENEQLKEYERAETERIRQAAR